MCVQRFDDSLNSAIHITYRISLRSSSLPEPRDPLLKVLFNLTCSQTSIFQAGLANSGRRGPPRAEGAPRQAPNPGRGYKGWGMCPEAVPINDPSAGSPTETLLRLLLPLNDQVCTTFRLWVVVADLLEPVRRPHLAIQSVVATGGVYKGQGRNQRMLMTCAY